MASKSISWSSIVVRKQSSSTSCTTTPIPLETVKQTIFEQDPFQRYEGKKEIFTFSKNGVPDGWEAATINRTRLYPFKSDQHTYYEVGSFKGKNVSIVLNEKTYYNIHIRQSDTLIQSYTMTCKQFISCVEISRTSFIVKLPYPNPK